MPPRPKRRASWAALVWILNGAGLLILLAVLITYWTREPAQAASSPFVYIGGTPRPTATGAPTSYYLPTITPNPFATAIEDYATPTPFVFAGAPGGVVIGHSVLGAPISVYSYGQGEVQYLIVAGIHGGNEGNTVDLANQLLVYVNEHPEFIPSSAVLFIVPDMNPDAVARGRNADARVNANGVDLNRNFPTSNWVPDWDHSDCWNERTTTGGSSGGSEPETRAVMNFIASHRIEAMISYHSAALGIFPGGNPWQPASESLAEELAKATGYPYPPLDIGCTYTGTLADWAVENSVGAAVDMELSNHSDTDFDQNLKALKVLLGFGE
ncbi:MAG: M14 family zinc carboxypeptidase [Anaerolineales bacterium]